MPDEVLNLEDPEGIDAYEAMMQQKPPPTPKEQAQIDAFISRVRKPLSPHDPRRHHFIPEFFLKRFSDANEHLTVVKVSDGRSKSLHTSDIAVWKDLYTHIDEEVGETVAVEKVLAEIDGLGARALHIIDFGIIPQAADRAALATWIAFLAVRNPSTRRTMEALFDQTYKLDLTLKRDPNAARTWLRTTLEREPTNDEVNDLVRAANHLDQFEMTPHQNEFIRLMLDSGTAMYPHLLRRRLTAVRFPERGLILSDCPLVLYQAPEHRRPFRGVGIINADELWLPINRSTAFVLHSDPNRTERFVNAPAHATLDSVNQAIALSASAEIYCHPDDLDRVMRLQLPEQDRPLLNVMADKQFDTGTDGIDRPPTRKQHHRYKKHK